MNRTSMGTMRYLFFGVGLVGGVILLAAGQTLIGGLLVAMAARLLVSPGARTAAYRMLAVSLFLLLSADVVYAVLSLTGGYYSGHPVDAGWLQRDRWYVVVRIRDIAALNVMR